MLLRTRWKRESNIKNFFKLITWVKSTLQLSISSFLKDFSVSQTAVIQWHSIPCLPGLNCTHTLVFFVSLLLLSPTGARSSVIISGGSQGEGAEAAGVFYGCSSRDNLFSSGTFLWHHKFLHFLWPALGGYKGHTWPVIVCLALSSVSLLLLLLTSSRARLSDCLKTLRSLRSGPIKTFFFVQFFFDEW